MSQPQPTVIKIILKSPSKDFDTIELQCSPQLSVGQLKDLISVRHPLKPPRNRQRLIYSGKELRLDDELLEQVCYQRDCTLPQAFHLVINRTEPFSSSRTNVGETFDDFQRQPRSPQQPQLQPQPPQPQFMRNFPHHAFPPQYQGYPGNFDGGAPQYWYNPAMQFPQHAYVAFGHPGLHQGYPIHPGQPMFNAQFPGPLPPQPHQPAQPGVIPPVLNNNHPPRFNRFPEINVALIFRLLVFAYLLSHGGSNWKMIALCVVGVLIYFYHTGRLRIISRFHLGRVQPPVVPNAAQGVNTNNPQQPAEPPRVTLGQEIANFVVPFFCSLFPNWEVPEGRQERNERENQNNARPHQD